MGSRWNTGSFNVNSFNSVDSFNTTINDDKAQVLRWMSSLKPQKRHQHLRESRLDGVGQWIFRKSKFHRWNMGQDGSGHSVLFCHGDLDVGRPILGDTGFGSGKCGSLTADNSSSLILDHFDDSGQDLTVAGLYCEFLD